MRGVFAITLTMFALGCSRGTPSGPLGEVDVTSQLPPDVPVMTILAPHEVTYPVCSSGEGDTPVELRVRWKTFPHGDGKYVAKYDVTLVKSGGAVVELEKEPVLRNVAPKGAPFLAEAKVSVKCTRRLSSKAMFEEHGTVFVRGDGTSGARK
jgi:hypothetical protein